MCRKAHEGPRRTHPELDIVSNHSPRTLFIYLIVMTDLRHILYIEYETISAQLTRSFPCDPCSTVFLDVQGVVRLGLGRSESFLV